MSLFNSLGRLAGNVKNAVTTTVHNAENAAVSVAKTVAAAPGAALHAAQDTERAAEAAAKRTVGWVGDTFTTAAKTVGHDLAVGAQAVGHGASVVGHAVVKGGELVVRAEVEGALVVAGLGILAVEGTAKGVVAGAKLVGRGAEAVGREAVREVKQTEAELAAGARALGRGLKTVANVAVETGRTVAQIERAAGDALVNAGMKATRATVDAFVAGAHFVGKLEDRAEDEAIKTIQGAEHWTQEQVDAFKAGYESTQTQRPTSAR